MNYTSRAFPRWIEFMAIIYVAISSLVFAVEFTEYNGNIEKEDMLIAVSCAWDQCLLKN